MPDIAPSTSIAPHTHRIYDEPETGLWCEHWGCPRPGRHTLDGAIACRFHERYHDQEPRP